MPWRSAAIVGQAHVGGRIAEIATALVAVTDLGADEPAIAEQACWRRRCRPSSSAARMRARRDRLGALDDRRRDDGIRDPRSRQSSAIARRAAPRPRRNGSRGRSPRRPPAIRAPADLTNSSARQRRERRVEVLHEHARRGRAAAKMASFTGSGVRRNSGLSGWKKAARMRLEGQDRAGPADEQRRAR